MACVLSRIFLIFTLGSIAASSAFADTRAPLSDDQKRAMMENAAQPVSEDRVFYRWAPKNTGSIPSQPLIDGVTLSEERFKEIMSRERSKGYRCGDGIYVTEKIHSAGGYNGRNGVTNVLMEVRLKKGTPLLDITNLATIKPLNEAGLYLSPMIPAGSKTNSLRLNPRIAVKYDADDGWWVIKTPEGVSFHEFTGEGLSDAELLQTYDQLSPSARDYFASVIQNRFKNFRTMIDRDPSLLRYQAMSKWFFGSDPSSEELTNLNRKILFSDQVDLAIKRNIFSDEISRGLLAKLNWKELLAQKTLPDWAAANLRTALKSRRLSMLELYGISRNAPEIMPTREIQDLSIRKIILNPKTEVRSWGLRKVLYHWDGPPEDARQVWSYFAKSAQSGVTGGANPFAIWPKRGPGEVAPVWLKDAIDELPLNESKTRLISAIYRADPELFSKEIFKSWFSESYAQWIRAINDATAPPTAGASRRMIPYGDEPEIHAIDWIPEEFRSPDWKIRYYSLMKLGPDGGRLPTSMFESTKALDPIPEEALAPLEDFRRLAGVATVPVQTPTVTAAESEPVAAPCETESRIARLFRRVFK